MSAAYPSYDLTDEQPVYRAYVVVADHFRSSQVLDCGNDERAIELARPLLSRGDAVEVWERARFITRVARG
jgi:hypothetical protein